MLKIALAIFAVAAVGGLVMAVRIFRDRMAPWALSVLHALLGAVGIGILIWALVTESPGSLVQWSLGLFVLAALGGFFLVSFHARQKLAPKAVVGIHALVAVVAFVLLAVPAFA